MNGQGDRIDHKGPKTDIKGGTVMISTEIFHVFLRRTSNSQPSIQQPSELTNLPVIYLGCICMCVCGEGGGV